MTWAVWNGLDIQCPRCNAWVSDGRGHMLILWANQHGGGVRIFCHHCGAVTDKHVTGKGQMVREVKAPSVEGYAVLDKERVRQGFRG